MNLALCFSLFLGLAVAAQSQVEDYYFYKGPKGELVISNKEPPPGSQIIKRVPGATAREAPQGQQPDKPQPNPQPEDSAKPSKSK